MARVVTSEAAVQLIGKLQRDIEQVQSSMNEMLRTGDQLASPQVWEGNAANRFRDQEWAQTRQWTARSIEQLTELRGTVHRINESIQSAGGGLG